METKIIDLWNIKGNIDPTFLEALKKLKAIQNLTYKEKNVIEFIEGKITSRVGDGENLINDRTTYKIAKNIAKYIKSNQKSNVLVINDSNENSLKFSKIFSSTLLRKGVKAFSIENNYPISDSIAQWLITNSDEQVDFFVSFSSNYDKKEQIISIYKEDGKMLSSNETASLNNFLKKSDLFEEKIEIIDSMFLKNSKNIQGFFDTFKTNKDLSNVFVNYTNNFNIEKTMLDYFFSVNNIKSVMTKNSKKTKMDSISRKSILSSINNKTNITVNFKPGNYGFELIIKHKKMRKFISLNEISLIYMYYKLFYSKNKDTYKNKKIITSIKSNKLINTMADELKIKTIELKNLSQDISNHKTITLDNILFATDGQGYTLLENSANYSNNTFHLLLEIIEIISYFQHKNMTLTDVLEEIYKKYEVVRQNNITIKMTNDKFNNMINSLKENKKISDEKIVNIRRVNRSNWKWIVKLEKKQEIYFEYFSFKEELKINYYLIDSSDKADNEEKKADLIFLEKDLTNNLQMLAISSEKKSFNYKNAFKYSLFVAFFIALFTITFYTVFGVENNVFGKIQQLFINNYWFMYVMPIFIFSIFFNIAISAYALKRILHYTNQEVALRHIIMSQTISMCISMITPLIFGGEAVGFWYLRRKGYKSPNIAAAYLVYSLFVQISITIMSVIFVPIGLSSLLPSFTWGPEDMMTIILIVIGVFFDFFSAFMIAIITFSHRLQTFIIKTLNYILEIIPFILIRDQNSLSVSMQYNLSKINKASKKVFKDKEKWKSIAIFFELSAYPLVATLFNVPAIMAISLGMFVDNNFMGFVNITASSRLLRAMNTINFLPSGIGLSDQFTKILYANLFQDNIIIEQYPPALQEDVVKDPTMYKTVDTFQVLTRLMYTAAPIVISAYMLLFTYIGERRIDKFKKISNIGLERYNLETNKKYKRTKTNYHIYGTFVSIIILFSTLAMFFLIMNFIVI